MCSALLQFKLNRAKKVPCHLPVMTDAALDADSCCISSGSRCRRNNVNQYPVQIAMWIITFCLPKFLLDMQLDPVLNCGVVLLCAVKQFTP